MIGPNRAAAFNRGRGWECILNPSTAAVRTEYDNSHFERIRSSEMNVKSIAEQLGERQARFALPSLSAHPLAERWRVSDFVALTKPRVMILAVFTALVGLSIAPSRLDPLTTFAAVLAIAAGAGAAGALNMWYDADIDMVMSRTAMRPIPRGKISRFEALVFGLVLGGFAVAVLALATNLTAAVLLACTILFYIVVYTVWLKRATRQNIVIGGAAGALPPVIGWAAGTGEVGLEPLTLFLIIFLWTPPHFWALALNRTDDYARAGVPMLPVVAGRAATTRQILLYSGLLVLASELPWVLGFAGMVYGVTAAICGALFLLLAGQLNRSPLSRRPEADRRLAQRLFLFSISYLFVLFAALLIDHGGESFSSMRSSRDGRTAASVHAELPLRAVRNAWRAVNFSEV
jgi:protoheme IX farnesyltransferase